MYWTKIWNAINLKKNYFYKLELFNTGTWEKTPQIILINYNYLILEHEKKTKIQEHEKKPTKST